MRKQAEKAGKPGSRIPSWIEERMDEVEAGLAELRRRMNADVSALSNRLLQVERLLPAERHADAPLPLTIVDLDRIEMSCKESSGRKVAVYISVLIRLVAMARKSASPA